MGLRVHQIMHRAQLENAYVRILCRLGRLCPCVCVLCVWRVLSILPCVASGASQAANKAQWLKASCQKAQNRPLRPCLHLYHSKLHLPWLGWSRVGKFISFWTEYQNLQSEMPSCLSTTSNSGGCCSVASGDCSAEVKRSQGESGSLCRQELDTSMQCPADTFRSRQSPRLKPGEQSLRPWKRNWDDKKGKMLHCLEQWFSKGVAPPTDVAGQGRFKDHQRNI